MTPSPAPGSVGRRPGRPSGATTDAIRRDLLDAARRHFARSGYDGATTRSIAEDAGVFPGSLRHHMGSKADTFGAVYDDCLVRVRTALSGSDAASPGDRLRALAAAVLAEADIAAFLAIAPIERARHQELRTPLGEVPRDLEGVIRSEIRALSRSGGVHPGIDSDDLADALIGATYGVLVQLSVVDPTAEPTGTVDAFARLVDGTVWREQLTSD